MYGWHTQRPTHNITHSGTLDTLECTAHARTSASHPGVWPRNSCKKSEGVTQNFVTCVVCCYWRAKRRIASHLTSLMRFSASHEILTRMTMYRFDDTTAPIMVAQYSSLCVLNLAISQSLTVMPPRSFTVSALY